jgi:hypothetical protein
MGARAYMTGTERMTLDDDRVEIFGRSGSRISRRRAIEFGSPLLTVAVAGPSVV